MSAVTLSDQRASASDKLAREHCARACDARGCGYDATGTGKQSSAHLRPGCKCTVLHIQHARLRGAGLVLTEIHITYFNNKITSIINHVMVDVRELRTL
jgi:hypothetical protein